MTYLTPVEYEDLPCGNKLSLGELRFEHHFKDPHSRVQLHINARVPPYAITDGITLPWPVRLFKRMFKDSVDEALLHDAMYATDIDRVMADALFFVALKHRCKPRWKRWVMFLGVFVFGGMFRDSRPRA